MALALPELETYIKIVHTLFDDNIMGRSEWSHAGTQLDAVLIEAFEWYQPGDEFSEYYFSNAICDIEDLILQCLHEYIPTRTWDVWAIRRVGAELYLSNLGDSRIPTTPLVPRPTLRNKRGIPITHVPMTPTHRQSIPPMDDGIQRLMEPPKYNVRPMTGKEYVAYLKTFHTDPHRPAYEAPVVNMIPKGTKGILRKIVESSPYIPDDDETWVLD